MMAKNANKKEKQKTEDIQSTEQTANAAGTEANQTEDQSQLNEAPNVGDGMFEGPAGVDEVATPAIPAPGPQEETEEEQPISKEEMQKLIDEKYEAGTLDSEELDKNFTKPEIWEYAEKHDILIDRTENKPELIQQVLDKISASEFYEKKLEERKLEGKLTEEDLEEMTVELIHEYADSHNFKYSSSDNKPELIVQVAKSEVRGPDQIVLVKDIRKEIDGTMLFVDNQQMEDKEAKQNLFYAKCWLGKLLEFLGADNPYKTKEKIKNALEIPPTADVANRDYIQQELHGFKLLSHLDGTLALRDVVQNTIDKIDSIDLSEISKENGRRAAICKTQAWTYACQAKFDLGYTLAKIREQ